MGYAVTLSIVLSNNHLSDNFLWDRLLSDNILWVNRLYNWVKISVKQPGMQKSLPRIPLRKLQVQTPSWRNRPN